MPEVLVALDPTELSDHEWAILAPVLPPAKPRGRPRSVHRQALLMGIVSVLRSGCHWRLLPRADGRGPRWRPPCVGGASQGSANASTPAGASGCGGRRGVGPPPVPPSASVTRSRPPSVAARTALMGHEALPDASGICRVDPLGVVQGVRVRPADGPDRAGARQGLPALKACLPRRELIWAERASAGPWQTWRGETVGWRMPIARAARRERAVAAIGPGAAPLAPRLAAAPQTLGRRKDVRVDRAQAADEHG
jgi:putative transposase